MKEILETLASLEAISAKEIIKRGLITQELNEVAEKNREKLRGVKILVLGGVSGCGKTSLLEALCKEREVVVPTSTTTRPRREGEDDGYYHFLTPEEFEKCSFVETVEYGGNKYGLTEVELERSLTVARIKALSAKGSKKGGPKEVLLVLIMEEKGAEQLSRYITNWLSISKWDPRHPKLVWIKGLSLFELFKRMYRRGDSIKSIVKRLWVDQFRKVPNSLPFNILRVKDEDQIPEILKRLENIIR